MHDVSAVRTAIIPRCCRVNALFCLRRDSVAVVRVHQRRVRIVILEPMRARAFRISPGQIGIVRPPRMATGSIYWCMFGERPCPMFAAPVRTTRRAACPRRMMLMKDAHREARTSSHHDHEASVSLCVCARVCDRVCVCASARVSIEIEVYLF